MGPGPAGGYLPPAKNILFPKKATPDTFLFSESDPTGVSLACMSCLLVAIIFNCVVSFFTFPSLSVTLNSKTYFPACSPVTDACALFEFVTEIDALIGKIICQLNFVMVPSGSYDSEPLRAMISGLELHFVKS